MQTMSGSSFPTARRLLVGSALSLALALSPRPAAACGGFFCSATNPVNQAAERIIFAKNADRTVTAVIEIQYQGPSTDFSWLLPISEVPTGDKLAVASNAAFQILQQATNPQYNLTTRVEGTCDVDQSTLQGSSKGSGNFAPSLGIDEDHGVTVEASGSVGPYDWTAISVAESTADPAQAAITWLGDNGYDIPEGARGLLGPYLADGMYLLALRLQKGADVGSIRPIVLTYGADKPMIPIKLTAVAANDDMGVMTWLLGDERAVPENYYSLELNEARINWFNASANYNQVVNAAADDAGGQGFVTEMAGPTAALKDVIWSSSLEQQWSRIELSSAANQLQAYQDALGYFQAYDGFWEVVEKYVRFSAGTTFEQVKECLGCIPPLSVDAGFTAALETEVIEPMRLVQRLVDEHPQMTRLYTTLSAAEMTADPLFTFNPDLGPVNNIHTAERIIECAPGYYQSEAPWRIELPSGGVVRGGPSDVGIWPTAFDAQSPNRRILRQGASGDGQVLEDHTQAIVSAVTEYSATVPTPERRETSSGCSLTGQRQRSDGRWLLGLGLSALLFRRRR
jgi:hypothetical protein